MTEKEAEEYRRGHASDVPPASLWNHNKTGTLYEVVCLSHVNIEDTYLLVSYRRYSDASIRTMPLTHWREQFTPYTDG